MQVTILTFRAKAGYEVQAAGTTKEIALAALKAKLDRQETEEAMAATGGAFSIVTLEVATA